MDTTDTQYTALILKGFRLNFLKRSSKTLQNLPQFWNMKMHEYLLIQLCCYLQYVSHSVAKGKR